MIKELDPVVLATDVPEHGLKAGDIGTVVLIHGAKKGYEIEFTALDGETIVVATLSAEKIRPVRHREIPHARQVVRA